MQRNKMKMLEKIILELLKYEQLLTKTTEKGKEDEHWMDTV